MHPERTFRRPKVAKLIQEVITSYHLSMSSISINVLIVRTIPLVPLDEVVLNFKRKIQPSLASVVAPEQYQLSWSSEMYLPHVDDMRREGTNDAKELRLSRSWHAKACGGQSAT
jgi:hypothetical protein